jgi:serine O-acetyltransferase
MLLRLHSIAHWCYLHKIPFVPYAIKMFIFVVFKCVLPPEAEIGPGTRLWHHGWCIGMLPTVKIGRNCNIYNQVEIAHGSHSRDMSAPPVHIIIGDRVNICTGAKVLCKSGTLTIGEGSTIGANALVIRDVPPNSVVVGIPARCIPKKRRPELAPNPHSALLACSRSV